MKYFKPTTLLIAATPLLLTTGASAQYSFSIDWHSPTVSAPDTFGGVPITEGDILIPALGMPSFGPLATPGTVISAGPLGLGLPLYSSCVGHVGGTPCAVEVDALSYGKDYPLDNQAGNYLFSTDEFAVGLAGPTAPPDISTEAPCGDSSADIWINAGFLPPGPLPPFAAPVGHTGLVDGDGLLSCSGAVYPGTGVREPNFPGFPNTGDNLDALDMGQGFATGFPITGVYFSLDEGFPDLLSGVLNSGSALASGFTGADILWTATPGGPPMVWGPAPMLGLNLTGAVDDLDALAICENGLAGFQPSQSPYDWLPIVGTAPSDMVLFSVRRGSAVIGMPDSIFGLPIEEGDILTTPLSTTMGGVSPFPGIFCAAENIGLVTARSFGALGDDLNALDTILDPGITDCNGNGVDDAIDIGSGASTDVNGNGIPDECEVIETPYCYCAAALAPCGNGFPSAGCRNSTGIGALLSSSGSSSVAADNLVLTVTGMPLFQPGIIYMGNVMVGPLPFGDGLRCVGGAVTRFPVMFSGATGSISIGPGIIGAGAPIAPFSIWNFQGWYRDPVGPCGTGFNLSNATSVTFTP